MISSYWDSSRTASCNVCGGAGSIDLTPDGPDSHWRDCPACHPRGTCSICEGECVFHLPRPPRPEPLTAQQILLLQGDHRTRWQKIVEWMWGR